MNSPVYLWLVLEEQRLERLNPDRHNPHRHHLRDASLARRAARPRRATALRQRVAAAFAGLRRPRRQPLPAAGPVGCAV